MSNPKRMNYWVLIGVLVGLYGNWLIMVGQKIFELNVSDSTYSFSLSIFILFFIVAIFPINVRVSPHMTFREKLEQLKLAYGFHKIAILTLFGIFHIYLIYRTINYDLQLWSSAIFSSMGLTLWCVIIISVILDHLVMLIVQER